MTKRIATVLIALLVAVPVSAGVYVDYDRTADMKSFKTFTWIDKPGTSMEYQNKLLHSRLKNYIEYLLAEGGMHEAEENPDLLVTYHVSSDTEMSLDVSTYGYGWGPGFGWDPYWAGSSVYATGMTTASTTVRSYQVGTLIIDIVRAEDKMLVWRGSATGIVVPENPEKLQKKIKKAVDKMVAKWRKMRDKG